MKTYWTKAGYYDEGKPLVWVQPEGGEAYHLPERQDLDNHSPAGFAWGYSGSGPAQLALALLADMLDDDALALQHHQMFKFKVIAHLPQEEGFRLDEAELMKAYEAIVEKGVHALNGR